MNSVSKSKIKTHQYLPMQEVEFNHVKEC